MTEPTSRQLIAHPPREGRVRALLRRARWRRPVTVALGILASLVVLYLVVANFLLRTRLLRNLISEDPIALRVDYESAYSIIPGRIHVEGLTIRGRTRTEEWRLILDHADASISLFELVRRTFHVTHLRSSGFTIRARIRIDRVDATPDVMAALPPIEGFADPPLLDGGPEPPPLTDANYNLWAINLEDVEVQHVREVWVHTLRAKGDTRVRGRWLFHPARLLDVGPATVDANGVDIFYGSQPLATGLRGSVEATVHPFDLRYVKGAAILDHVSHSGQLRGRAIIAGALRLLAPRSGVSFTRWEGPLDARIVVDHGKLLPGTRVRTEATDCVVEAAGLAFEAPIRSDLGVDTDRVTLDTRVSGLRVSRRGAEQGRVSSIAATVTSSHMKLADAFDDARFTLDVAGAETNDVGAWKHLLPSTSPFVIRSGKVTADGHADGSLVERRGRAELRLLARRLNVNRGSSQFIADVTSIARLLDVSLAGGWVVGAATITADDLAARLGRAFVAGKLAAHVELRRGTWADRTFDFSASKVVLRTVSVSSKRSGAAILTAPSLTAVAPRFAVAPSGVDGHVSIDLPRADLVDLRRLREVLPLPTALRVERGRAQARFSADVELGSGSMRGDGEVVTRGLRVRVGETKLFGDLAGKVRARRSGGATGSTDVSGSTLAIKHAGTGNAVPVEDRWWGNVALRKATLRTNEGVRFDAKAHLTAKDATPATVLVSQNTGVPSWAVNIFRMPGLDADAEVRLMPSSFEVRSLVARGGSTSVRAEYAKRDGRTDGAVLMDLGWINLGYDLADGATGIVLFGPQHWFAGKTATMRNAAAAAKRKTDAAEQLARYAALTPQLRQDVAKALAARCELEVRSCDGTSMESLLRAAADTGERDTLSGITYAPLLVAAAKGGKDGTLLDPVVIGSVAEALRLGGESTLDNVPRMTRVAAANDSDGARGKVITVTGRSSSIRSEGPYSVGMLRTDAEPVYFVTPFATNRVAETFARFRGVFVQRYSSRDQSQSQPPSLVLVGAFVPELGRRSGVDSIASTRRP
jgi:hypothetical protein